MTLRSFHSLVGGLSGHGGVAPKVPQTSNIPLRYIENYLESLLMAIKKKRVVNGERPLTTVGGVFELVVAMMNAGLSVGNFWQLCLGRPQRLSNHCGK